MTSLYKTLLLTLSLAAAAPHKPATMIKVEHYAALKDVLAPGDIVYAFAARQPDGFHSDKFSAGVAALGAIHDPQVEKMVVLSSIDDLKANLSRLPKDLRWIAYNMEPQMTPREEILDPLKAVTAFARLCHEHRLKLSWVPSGFRMFATEERLTPIAPNVDAIVMQHQRELQDQG